MERHRKGTARGHQNQVKQLMMLDLPSVIVIDILSRLSTTTLISCRCVCKTWFNLLSDPLFIKIRLGRPAVKDVVFCAKESFYLLELEDDSNRPMKFNPGFDHIKPRLVLVGSCNGLLCFWEWLSIETLYICNPILGECAAVPKSERVTHAWITYMFGFSASSGHYKIVKLHIELESEVYTLGTDAWRKIGNVPFPSHIGTWFYITLNGTLHWITSKISNDDQFIFSFDIGKEQGRPIIPLPSKIEDKSNMRLGVLENCLCIFNHCWSTDHLDIWTMKDYGVAESWTNDRILTTSIPSNMHHHNFAPITVQKDGEILFLCVQGPLASYDPKTRIFTQLNIYGIRPSYAVAYASSFLSPKDFLST